MICIICFALSVVCFLVGARKGYLAVYISMMARGLRPELISPAALLAFGCYLMYLSYKFVPFMIVWKN
jgi:hypothetical protein